MAVASSYSLDFPQETWKKVLMGTPSSPELPLVTVRIPETGKSMRIPRYDHTSGYLDLTYHSLELETPAKGSHRLGSSMPRSLESGRLQ